MYTFIKGKYKTFIFEVELYLCLVTGARTFVHWNGNMIVTKIAADNLCLTQSSDLNIMMKKNMIILCSVDGHCQTTNK